jgi:hypothetical protein
VAGWWHHHRRPNSAIKSGRQLNGKAMCRRFILVFARNASDIGVWEFFSDGIKPFVANSPHVQTRDLAFAQRFRARLRR